MKRLTHLVTNIVLISSLVFLLAAERARDGSRTRRAASSEVALHGIRW